jgi:hypothetical protein
MLFLRHLFRADSLERRRDPAKSVFDDTAISTHSCPSLLSCVALSFSLLAVACATPDVADDAADQEGLTDAALDGTTDTAVPLLKTSVSFNKLKLQPDLLDRALVGADTDGDITISKLRDAATMARLSSEGRTALFSAWAGFPFSRFGSVGFPVSESHLRIYNGDSAVRIGEIVTINGNGTALSVEGYKLIAAKCSRRLALYAASL